MKDNKNAFDIIQENLVKEINKDIVDSIRGVKPILSNYQKTCLIERHIVDNDFKTFDGGIIDYIDDGYCDIQVIKHGFQTFDYLIEHIKNFDENKLNKTLEDYGIKY